MKKYLLTLALALAFAASATAQTSIGPVTLDSATCPGTGCVTMGVQGNGSASIQAVGSGTWTAVAEASLDGVTFNTLAISATNGSGNVTSFAASGAWITNVAGFRVLRIRISSYTNGNVTVFANAHTSGGGASGGGGGGGDATAANQSTMITALQLIDNLPLVEDGVHSSGETGALVLGVRNDAGTALAADGDRIPLSIDSTGAVRVTGGGGGVQFAEDAVHASGATGTLALVVRADTAAQLAGTDGDYSALITDSTGRLHVNVGNTVTVGSHAVTNAGTFATQVDGAALTALQLIDDTVRSEDSVSGDGQAGNVILAVRRDAAGSSSGADGDYSTFNVDASGRLWVNCGTGCSGGTQFAEDAAHANADVGTVAMAVRRDTAAAGSGTDGDYSTLNVDSTGRLWSNTEFMDAFAGADNVANPTTTAVHALNYVWDGSAWDRAQPSLATEATHDAALTVASSVGTLPVVVAKDFDGAALPNAVSAEGDAQFLSASLSGVLYAMLVNEDGSATGQVRVWDGVDTVSIDGSGNLAVSCSNCSGSGVSVNEDTASADAHPGTPAYSVRQDSPSTTTSADGDYQPLKSSSTGRLYTSTTIDAAIPAGTNNIGDVDVLTLPGTGTEDAGESAGGTLIMSGTVRRDTAASSAGTTGDNATANTDSSGLLWSRQMDPCTALNPTTVPISVAADTAVISAGGASTRTYICGGALVATAAEIVNIWEGTGTACGTSSAALAGSTTEANGMSLAANGGFLIPNTIRGIGTNVDVCIRLSTTNRVSGWLSYVQVAQ